MRGGDPLRLGQALMIVDFWSSPIIVPEGMMASLISLTFLTGDAVFSSMRGKDEMGLSHNAATHCVM